MRDSSGTTNRTSLVAFEGLNGVGKTTLCEGVSKELGLVAVRTPPFESSRERTLFDDDPFSPAAMLYYLSWVKWVDERVQSGQLGAVVLCDRYIQSTIAYFGGVGQPPDRVLELIPIRQPDVTVLVTTEESVRWDRLSARSKLRRIEDATRHSAFREFAMRTFRASPVVVEVDTTVDSPLVSIALCSALLRKSLLQL